MRKSFFHKSCAWPVVYTGIRIKLFCKSFILTIESSRMVDLQRVNFHQEPSILFSIFLVGVFTEVLFCLVSGSLHGGRWGRALWSRVVWKWPHSKVDCLLNFRIHEWIRIQSRTLAKIVWNWKDPISVPGAWPERSVLFLTTDPDPVRGPGLQTTPTHSLANWDSAATSAVSIS